MSGTPYADAVAADAPDIWWKLNEPSGTTAADSSGNEFHGTHTGAAAGGDALTADEGDASVAYDGTDDYTYRDAAIDSEISKNSDVYPFTLECIVKTSGHTSDMAAVGIVRNNSSRPWRVIGVTSAGAAYASVQDSVGTISTLSGGSVADGNPHHIVGVWASATERYLYVDGELVAGSNEEDDSGSANIQNAAYFGAGARLSNISGSSPQNPFKGNLAHAACYLEKALSAERVAAHAAAMTADGPGPPTATGLPGRKFTVRPCVRPVMYPCVRPCVGG